MSARQPRFEVVHSDAGWFARFRAANSQIVWQTEVYTRRRRAAAAVELITGSLISESPFAAHPEVTFGPLRAVLEVQTVDERTAVTA